MNRNKKKTKELTIFCPRPYLLINIYIIRLNGSIHAKHPIYVLFHSQFFFITDGKSRTLYEHK